jgi:hypothetical protein
VDLDTDRFTSGDQIITALGFDAVRYFHKNSFKGYLQNLLIIIISIKMFNIINIFITSTLIITGQLQF